MTFKREQVHLKILLFMFYKQWFFTSTGMLAIAFTLNSPVSVQIFSLHHRTKNPTWPNEVSISMRRTSPILARKNTIKNECRSIQSFADDVSETINFSNLPRLYIGAMHHNNPVQSTLLKNERINLSYDQSHYLLKVLRFFTKKRKRSNFGIKKAHTEIAHFDASECVRLFNGSDGEWLCRVIDPAESNMKMTGSENRSKVRKIRKRKGDVEDHSKNLVAECLFQLRPQHRPSNLSTCMNVEEKQSEETEYRTSSSPLDFEEPWLLFAPIKKQRAKFLVEKCTELGCGLFCPVMTEHTDLAASCVSRQSKYSQATRQYDLRNDGYPDKDDAVKLSLVSRGAAEQCERLTVPAFVSTSDLFPDNGHERRQHPSCVEYLLKNWVSSSLCPLSRPDSDQIPSVARMLFICRERKENDSPSGVLHISDAFEKFIHSPIAFFVGPEGGWSPEEEQLFDEYCTNYPHSIVGVSLGAAVLRAETAGMMVIGAYNLWSSNSRIKL